MYKSLKDDSNQFINMIKNHISQIKKENKKQLILEREALLFAISEGENLDFEHLKNKYISKKKLKKIVVENNNDIDLYEVVNLDGAKYYYENKNLGNIYNENNEKVGVFKDNNFLLN